MDNQKQIMDIKNDFEDINHFIMDITKLITDDVYAKIKLVYP